MANQTLGFIPVFSAKEIVDWAVVDETDFLWVSQWHWHLSMGYPAFSKRPSPKVVDGVRVQQNSVRHFMHRHLMHLGYADERVVDHINGDKLDNRKVNLRILSLAENGQNKPSYKDSTSRYRGVSWYESKKKWRVQVVVKGVRTLVGYFDSEEEAGAAADSFYDLNIEYRRQEALTVERPGSSLSEQVVPCLLQTTVRER